jgi:hypothetical protein
VMKGVPKHQGFVVGKIDAAGNIGTHGVFVDNDQCCPPAPRRLWATDPSAPAPSPPPPAPSSPPPAPPPGVEPAWVPRCK